jgi:hypothetical protein
MASRIPRSTLYFVTSLLGACVMLASFGTWFVMSDMDYHFSFSEMQEDAQRYETVEYYELRSEAEREIVHAAVDDGESFSFEEQEQVPGSVIHYEGTDYVFDTYGYYDWFDPGTGGPAILGFFGLVLMADAARRDVTYG